jgi:hypothetical protein
MFGDGIWALVVGGGVLGLGIAIWDAGLKIWGFRAVNEMYSNAKQNQKCVYRAF